MEVPTTTAGEQHRSLRWFRAGIAVLLLFAIPALGSACELRMGWEPWKPYQYRDSDGNLKGLDIDLIRAIATRMDCDLTLIEQPWARHLRELRAGRIDLAAGADYSPERARHAYFSDPYRTESVRLFMRHGEVDQYAFSELSDVAKEGLTVGVTRGYKYGDPFQALKESPDAQNHIEMARSDLLNYRKLARGRVDAILADPRVLEARVKNSAFEGAFEAHPLPIKQTPIHFIFSRKSTSKALVQRFNNALITITDTRLYDRIVNSYVTAQ